jgi:hypothetical protein
MADLPTANPSLEQVRHQPRERARPEPELPEPAPSPNAVAAVRQAVVVGARPVVRALRAGGARRIGRVDLYACTGRKY